jgi:hypothetical protein
MALPYGRLLKELLKNQNWSAPACWCGFPESLSSDDIRTSKFLKIAKASFRTPKTTFSTRP